MAAELSTGALVLRKVKDLGQPVSTLVTGHKGYFTKKAIGKLKFICEDGLLCDEIIGKAINTGEAVKITLNTRGINERGEEVSTYQFEWSIKLRTKT